ncbi:MAG: hypothetical protein LBD21_10380, partial [Tannerellaceae bacterium]|nr:hypothetical protein [Tannerellaceae bacterium]
PVFAVLELSTLVETAVFSDLGGFSGWKLLSDDFLELSTFVETAVLSAGSLPQMWSFTNSPIFRLHTCGDGRFFRFGRISSPGIALRRLFGALRICGKLPAVSGEVSAFAEPAEMLKG